MAGEKRKRMTFEDEKVHAETRRSSRIIVLEEKKRIEEERRMALALEMKSDSANRGKRSKDKGKAKINEIDGLDDLNEHDEQGNFDEKEGRQTRNGNASKIKVPYMPRKDTLERILDKLQREEDPDELFAEPDNLDHMVENQCPIVKQPMDFATMRAKLHEDLYTSLNLFKRDVFLMCSNAMTTNPTNTRKHKVAKAISARAWKCFDKLSAKIARFDLGISKYKTGTSEKSQDRRPRTLKNERVPRKPSGRKNVKTFETDKRDIYKPPTPVRNSSIVTEAKIQQPHDDHPTSSNWPQRIYGNSSVEGNKNVNNSTSGNISAAEARAIAVLANIYLKNKGNNKGEIGNTSGCYQSPNATRGITMDNIEGPSNKGRMDVFPFGNNNNNNNNNDNMPQLSGFNNADAVTVWPSPLSPSTPTIRLQGSIPGNTDHLELSLLHNPRSERSTPDMNLSSASSSLLPQKTWDSSVPKGPTWWGLGKGNIGTLSPIGREKNALSLSKQIPAGGYCFAPRVTPSHVANASVTPCETGSFQALLGSPQLIQHQAAASYNAPPAPTTTHQGLPDLQVKTISHVNSQAPFHHQEARPSSSTGTPQTPVAGALNRRGRGEVWLFGSRLA